MTIQLLFLWVLVHSHSRVALKRFQGVGACRVCVKSLQVHQFYHWKAFLRTRPAAQSSVQWWAEVGWSWQSRNMAQIDKKTENFLSCPFLLFGEKWSLFPFKYRNTPSGFLNLPEQIFYLDSSTMSSLVLSLRLTNYI